MPRPLRHAPEPKHRGYSIQYSGDINEPVYTKLSETLEWVYQSREAYKNVKVNSIPQYITQGLLNLARNDDYLKILRAHKNKVLIYSNQYEIKSALAEELNETIDPTFFIEEGKVIDFGRGNQYPCGPTGSKFRYIHPVTAMQTFNHFYHIELNWKGHLKKFYPDDADYSAVMECAKLCAHFFGGFASTPITLEQAKSLYPNLDAQLLSLYQGNINTYHRAISSGVKRGPKTVGPPGTGKTTLLSTITLSSALNDINTTVCVANDDSFGLLTTDFSNPLKIAATIRTFNNPHFPQNSGLYIDSLRSALDQSIPSNESHCLTIDPLEQNNSDDILDHAEAMYNFLAENKPLLTTFSAHSTPYLRPPEQGKSDPASYLLGLQFTNMELSQQSLIKLFKSIINYEYPQTTSQPLNSELHHYLALASTFTVPTIRSWHSFFNTTKSQLLQVLRHSFPTSLPTTSDSDYGKTNFLNSLNLGQLSTVPFVTKSSYSHYINDIGGRNCTVSAFLRGAVRKDYTITRRFGIDEENAICVAAGLNGAYWLDPGGKKIDIKYVHELSSFEPGEFKTTAKSTTMKEVLAKYYAELDWLAHNYKPGVLYRLSTDFPLVDFVLFDDQGCCYFFSLKTGGKDNNTNLYSNGCQIFEDFMNHRVPGSVKSHRWQVWVTSQKLEKNKNALLYNVPEDIFHVSTQQFQSSLEDDLKTKIPSWSGDFSFFHQKATRDQ